MLKVEDTRPDVAPRRQPFVIGLTGPIASGKSTVAEMLRERGARVIDADKVYASLILPGSSLLDAIAARFGPDVIRENGELDRTALAALVFNNPAALADLDRLTHPAVVAEVRREIAQSSAEVVAVEAIKLTQSGLLGDVEALWYVDAEPAARVARLMERAGIDRETAQTRVAAASEPLPAGVVPDVIIDNSGDRAATSLAVAAAWHVLTASGVLLSGKRRNEEELG